MESMRYEKGRRGIYYDKNIMNEARMRTCRTAERVEIGWRVGRVSGGSNTVPEGQLREG